MTASAPSAPARILFVLDNIGFDSPFSVAVSAGPCSVGALHPPLHDRLLLQHGEQEVEPDPDEGDGHQAGEDVRGAQEVAGVVDEEPEAPLPPGDACLFKE